MKSEQITFEVIRLAKAKFRRDPRVRGAMYEQLRGNGNAPCLAFFVRSQMGKVARSLSCLGERSFQSIQPARSHRNRASV